MALIKGELKGSCCWVDQNISKTGLFKAHRIILRIPRIEKRQNVTFQKTDQNEGEKMEKKENGKSKVCIEHKPALLAHVRVITSYPNNPN